ncbi:transposase [Rhodoferax ferrireducens]|uniref:transposase n=1 Tax=Rhodoferax ferrireducens TaxID=192843 RepID=UPI000E0DF556
MATTSISPALPGRRLRRHSEQFKSEVIGACRQPGVSIAGVALANGLNANLLRRWVVEAGRGVGAGEGHTGWQRERRACAQCTGPIECAPDP